MQRTYPKPWPWSIQVEPVGGCDRKCWFCAIPHLPSEFNSKGNLISLELIEKVFLELNEWLGSIRVEFNSHGEPTLHPQWLDILHITKRSMPKASLNLQTNTENWFPKGTDYIRQMFDAGLDVLVLNAYKHGLYEQWVELLQRDQIPFVDYYYNNPEKISANERFLKKPGQLGRVILWDDLGQVNVQGVNRRTGHQNKTIHNCGGNADTAYIEKRTGRHVEVPMDRRCSKVHREIILGWNGIVPICCQDWQDVFVMGNANVQSLKEIWYSERWTTVRQLLYRRRRDLLQPCAVCTDPTNRTGLDADPGLTESDEELLAKLDLKPRSMFTEIRLLTGGHLDVTAS